MTFYTITGYWIKWVSGRNLSRSCQRRSTYILERGQTVITLHDLSSSDWDVQGSILYMSVPHINYCVYTSIGTLHSPLSDHPIVCTTLQPSRIITMRWVLPRCHCIFFSYAYWFYAVESHLFFVSLKSAVIGCHSVTCVVTGYWVKTVK